MQSPGVFVALYDLAGLVRGQGGLVVWTRHRSDDHPSRADDELPLRASPGWWLVDEPDRRDVVIDVCGREPAEVAELSAVLRDLDVRALALGGFGNEATVGMLAQALDALGHDCVVLSDGCAPQAAGDTTTIAALVALLTPRR